MRINFLFFSNEIISLSTETVFQFLGTQYKKIAAIVAITFGCLICCALRRKLIQKSERLNVDDLSSTQKQVHGLALGRTLNSDKQEKISPKKQSLSPQVKSLPNPTPDLPQANITQAPPLSHQKFDLNDSINTEEKLTLNETKTLFPQPKPIDPILDPSKNHRIPASSLSPDLPLNPTPNLSEPFKSLSYLRNIYEKDKNEKTKAEIECCLDAIFCHDELKNFLNTFPKNDNHYEFFGYLTSKERLSIDWNKKDPKTLQILINGFFDHATKTEFTAFVKNDACALKRGGYKDYELFYPSFTNLFFKELTNEREQYLADLSIEDPLLPAIACCEKNMPKHLLTLLYNENPDSELWEKIRSKASSYSKLVVLTPSAWILDTMALIKQFPNDPSLPTKLKDLFDKFKFPEKDIASLNDFAWLFLNSAESLNLHQLNAFAWGLAKAPLFVTKGYDFTFMQKILDVMPTLDLPNPDQMIVPLLQEFVSLTANSSDGEFLESLVSKMTTKEQIKAFIAGVSSCPEPWRTIGLRLLILKDNEEISWQYQGTKISLEERKSAFSACGLDYNNYQPIESSFYFSISTIEEHTKCLQDLDNEDKLIKFLDSHSNRSRPPKKCFLRALAAGITISKDVTLKPSLDSQVIKENFTKRGFIFDSYNSPISIEDFCEEI